MAELLSFADKLPSAIAAGATREDLFSLAKTIEHQDAVSAAFGGEVGGPGIDSIEFEPLIEEGPSITPVQTTMSESIKENPDQRAKVLELADKTGVPAETVAHDVEAVETRNKFDSIDFEGMSKRSPVTTAFLTDYDNSSIAHDDISALEFLENTLTSLGGAFKYTPPGIAIEAGKYAIDVAPDVATSFKRGQAIVTSGNIGFEQAMLNLTGQGALSPEKLAQLELSEADKSVEGSKRGFVGGIIPAASEQLPIYGEILSGGLISALPGALGGAGIGALGFGAGAIPMAFVGGSLTGRVGLFYEMVQLEGGNAALEFRGLTDENGVTLDPVVADSAGMVVGVINGMLEATSLKAMGKVFTGGKGLIKSQIKAALRDPTKRDIILSIAGRFATAVATEGVTEMFQEMSNILGGEMAKLFDENAFQEQGVMDVVTAMAEPENIARVGEAGYKGVQASILFAGMGTAVSTIVEANTVKSDSEIEQGKIDKIVEITETSKVKERSSIKFRQFVEEAAPGEVVYIDGPQAALYLQSVEADTTDPVLSKIAEQVEQANQTNGEVMIPISDFATDIIGSDHFDALRPHMTMSTETVSPFRQEAEAQQKQDHIKSIIAEAQENISQYAENQNIFNDAVKQLVDSKQMSKRVAKYAAQIVPAVMTVHSNRTGVPIETLYNQIGLKIEGPFQEREAAVEAGQTDLLEGILPPNVMEQQDFGDTQFEDTIEREATGETMTVTKSAQRTFDQKQKQRTMAQNLLDCVSNG